MLQRLVRLYNSAEFGLGIKPYLNRFFSWAYHQHCRTQASLLCWLDNHLLLSLLQKLNRHFYDRAKHHYGADYRWGDELSQNLDSRTANLGYGLLHYAMVRNQRPSSILCVGSMYGFIPFLLAKACENNQHGHVYFVDAGYNAGNPRHKKHFFGQGFWKKRGAGAHFRYLLQNPKRYISLHVTTSETFAKRYPQLLFDYVYLDGDHSYKGVKRDIRLFWNRLRDDGYLCLHDISYNRPDTKIQIDMKKIWKEVVSVQKIEFTNNYSGLGFIKKTSNSPPL